MIQSGFPDGSAKRLQYQQENEGNVAVRRLKKRRDIKKGATLCSNLVNLKSNTMKNTVQRYGFFGKLQIKKQEKYVL